MGKANPNSRPGSGHRSGGALQVEEGPEASQPIRARLRAGHGLPLPVPEVLRSAQCVALLSKAGDLVAYGRRSLQVSGGSNCINPRTNIRLRWVQERGEPLDVAPLPRGHTALR